MAEVAAIDNRWLVSRLTAASATKSPDLHHAKQVFAGCDDELFELYGIYRQQIGFGTSYIFAGGKVMLVRKPISFSKLNEGKMDFSDLYTSNDPRNYFKYLGQLDYIIPHLAQPIFEQVIRARRQRQDAPVTVLDLGCSYAINGALM